MEKLKKYKYVIVTAAAAAVIAAAMVLCGIFGRDVGISSESAAESSSETFSTYTLRSETIETTPPPVEQSTATDTSTPARTPAQTVSATSYDTTTTQAELTLPQTSTSNQLTTTAEPQTVVTKPQTAPPAQASDVTTQTVVTKPQTFPTKPQTSFIKPQTTKPQTTKPQSAATKPQSAATKPQTATPAQTEPQYQHYCGITIDCSTILDNMDKLDKNKVSLVPADGIIYSSSKVGFNDKESVFEILKRVCRENGIALEASYTPAFGSSYIEGINNIYEFDCGSASGWLYMVNGNSPGAGCSSYIPNDGDRIEFIYTCTLGEDVNGGV